MNDTPNASSWNIPFPLLVYGRFPGGFELRDDWWAHHAFPATKEGQEFLLNHPPGSVEIMPMETITFTKDKFIQNFGKEEWDNLNFTPDENHLLGSGIRVVAFTKDEFILNFDKKSWDKIEKDSSPPPDSVETITFTKDKFIQKFGKEEWDRIEREIQVEKDSSDNLSLNDNNGGSTLLTEPPVRIHDP